MYAEPKGNVFRNQRWRGFRLALVAFQFLWLNIIVPGHQRGIVSLPGTQCEACETPAAPPARACCAHHPKTPPAVPLDKANHCAICFFAARLSPAIAVDFTHPPLRMIARLDAPLAPLIHSPEFAFTYHGRAPPTAA